MAAIRQDHTLWRGTSPTIAFSVVDDDGVAVDVTGWTAVYTLRLHASDPDPAALSIAGAIFGAPAAGVFRVAITKAQLLALAAGNYQFSFERTNSGNEDVLAFGVATLRLDIRNAA